MFARAVKQKNINKKGNKDTTITKQHVVTQNSTDSEDEVANERLDERYLSDLHSGNAHVTALGESKGEEDEGELLLKQVVLGGDTDLVDSGFSDAHEPQSPKHKRKKIEKVPVWEDEDDANVQKHTQKRLGRVKGDRKRETFTGEAYKETLKSRFESVVGEARWAKLKWQKDKHDYEEDEDAESSDLLRSTGNYIQASEALAKGCIQMEKCTDANKESRTKGRLTSVEFHPTSQVLLTAGTDQRLNIFQVDGKENPKIQSVFIEQFPISSAHFTRDGMQVVMGSKKKRGFYYYDMIEGKIVKIQNIQGLEEPHLSRLIMSPCGKYIVFYGHHGRMYFISTKSKEWIDTVKMNGQVNSVAFNNDGSRMYSHGTDGEVYVWDMNTRSCIHKFTDDGALSGKCVAVSRNDQYIATGCESGVVNIYDATSCHTSCSPRPVSCINNLVTRCTHAMFNPTSEVLALASDQDKKALKLVHFPSMTVFSNFPDPTDKFDAVTCMDFSLNSGYFCAGDAKGNASLYRMKHYSNY